MTDVPVDTAVAAPTPAVEGLTEAEEEELRAELTKVLSWGDREARPGCWLCSAEVVPGAVPGVPQGLLFAACALYVLGTLSVFCEEDVHAGQLLWAHPRWEILLWD